MMELIATIIGSIFKTLKFKQMKNIALIFIAIISFGLTACSDDDNSSSNYGIFSSIDNNTVQINGVINQSTPDDWNRYIKAYPNTQNAIMKDCPGSDDDNANLQTSRAIRQHGLNIHLPSDAVIASGATDMFLSGVKRTRDAGSKIGVHSWSDGTQDATAFPVGHQEHLLYINYYVEMGFSQADAEVFYYFTINSAPAAEIHWMTDAEIVQYKLLTQ